MIHYPKKHRAVRWHSFMPIVIHDILSREHRIKSRLDGQLINKVAGTYLGTDLSNFDNEEISRDELRKIARYLLPKAQKLDNGGELTTNYNLRKEINSMARYSDEELQDISLRNFYQKKLGKAIRAYQWKNLKLEIRDEFPEKVLTSELLETIAKFKLASPNWKVSRKSVGNFNYVYKSLDLSTGIDGASLFYWCRKLCRYNVTDRTIKQWFYDVCGTWDLAKNYTKEQADAICLKAVTSTKKGVQIKK